MKADIRRKEKVGKTMEFVKRMKNIQEEASTVLRKT